MARWQPDAGERLRAAALDLFAEQGFEQTSVAQIARRAELTERTFYRYYADKREVLFQGQEQLNDALAAGVAAAAEPGPLAVAVQVLDRAATFFDEERRPFSRRRQQVIDANPELLERERAKMAHLSDALAEGFRARGVPAVRAALAAGTVVSAFQVTFGLWVAPDEARGFAELGRAVVDELRSALATDVAS
ncbi:TetR/AcrR family transcriptional regulator [Luteimicrobium sp. DT211]|uniref:TetR/AcrR family transcriptional regulator n=1 Tax=Luteimicrobium sp. DT211 TaxID=3393412 RepID=UPI003CFBAA55